MSVISEALTDAHIVFNAEDFRELEQELWATIYRTGYNDAVSVEMGNGTVVGIDSENETRSLLDALNISIDTMSKDSIDIIESYIDYGYSNGYQNGGMDS